LVPERDVVFEQVLKELALEPARPFSSEEKELLSQYKGEVIKLVTAYHYRLSPENQEVFIKLLKRIAVGKSEKEEKEEKKE